MSYVSFVGDSTYAGVSWISWVYKLHERLDSRHVADSYYSGDGTENRLIGARWTFYNAAWAGKSLFEIYDGTDDRDGIWGQGTGLTETVISRYIPGTNHWVFIGGGLNDLNKNPTTEYVDRVLALRYKIEEEVRAAGMIPIQCGLTPWGQNQYVPFETQPNLAQDIVDYFNATLKKHCSTTGVQMQDFYTPLANSVRDSIYWSGYNLEIGNKIHFTPTGKTRMANSVNIGALGLASSFSLTTPIARTRARHGQSFPVFGYLALHQTVKSHRARIYKYKYVAGRWKSYGYVTANVSNYYGHSRYSTSLSLSKGKWRLWAYHPADEDNGARWSIGYDSVTVS